MTQWEYKGIDLYRGGGLSRNSEVFGKFWEEVVAAGGEGWEAVGPVQINWGLFNNTQEQSAGVLMFKRPMP